MDESLIKIPDLPLLAAEEEQALARAVQAGDQAARNRLIEANLRLVPFFARRFLRRGLPPEDVFAEGMQGLIAAAQRFEPGKGTRFATFAAAAIQWAILRAIESARMVSARWWSPEMLHGRRCRTSLRDTLGREPSTQELADALGIDLPAARRLKQADAQTTTNFTCKRGFERDRFDEMIDTRAIDPADAMAGTEARERAAAIIARLKPRAAEVLRLRYGLDGQGERTVAEVSAAIGVCEASVRWIEGKALHQLRHELQA